MNHIDLIKELNISASKKEFDIPEELEALDYLTGEKRRITIVINKDNYEVLSMAPVRINRKKDKQVNENQTSFSLASPETTYTRTAQEIKAVENFLQQEKTRIQMRIDRAKDFDKDVDKEEEIKKLKDKRTVPNFRALIGLYRRIYPDYIFPNEWWMDEVYVNTVLLEWLSDYTIPNTIEPINEGREEQSGNAKYSVPDYAMALIIKGIAINKVGIGIPDNTDYTKRFGIESKHTLYNNWNDLIKDKISQEKRRPKALELIKDKNL